MRLFISKSKNVTSLYWLLIFTPIEVVESFVIMLIYYLRHKNNGWKDQKDFTAQ
jgi:hypothetical protein